MAAVTAQCGSHMTGLRSGKLIQSSPDAQQIKLTGQIRHLLAVVPECP